MPKLSENALCGRTNCFANKCGRCSILERVDDEPACSFFKTRKQEADDVTRGYTRLLHEDRMDLIQQYRLGAFVREVNRKAAKA